MRWGSKDTLKCFRGLTTAVDFQQQVPAKYILSNFSVQKQPAGPRLNSCWWALVANPPPVLGQKSCLCWHECTRKTTFKAEHRYKVLNPVSGQLEIQNSNTLKREVKPRNPGKIHVQNHWQTLATISFNTHRFSFGVNNTWTTEFNQIPLKRYVPQARIQQACGLSCHLATTSPSSVRCWQLPNLIFSPSLSQKYYCQPCYFFIVLLCIAPRFFLMSFCSFTA